MNSAIKYICWTLILGSICDISLSFTNTNQNKILKQQQQQIETLTKKVDSLIIVQKINK